MEPNSTSNFLSAASFWEPEWIPEISAWWEHAPFAFWLIGQLRPRSFVELGVHWGYSYMACCQAVEKHGSETTCTAVDTWKGDPQSGFYDNQIYATLEQYNSRKYAHFSKLIRSSFDEARPAFAEKSIDLLHIDGLHTYEAVKHDFETWRPCISDCGVVIFHDTNVRENDFGVLRLWEELREKYPSFEFLHGYGLGILGVGNQLPVTLKNLFSIGRNSAGAHEIRVAYQRLGKAFSQEAAPRLPSEIRVEKPRSPALDRQLKKLQDEQFKLQKKYRDGLATNEKNFRKQERALLQQNKALRKIIQSAQTWQRRSWFQRAFHHWRAPALPVLKISPLISSSRPVSALTLKVLSTVFNEAYYLSKNPDATHSNLTPLEHYRTIGWKLNVRPHPLFDVVWYLQQNPDVAAAGHEPLQHYLEHGWKNGRAPHRFFDPDYYLQTFPDVLAKNQEPLGHYLQTGWKKDRQTSPHGRFDWQHEMPNLAALISLDDVTAILGTRFFSWLKNRDANKPVILLVTHESTRTGAPIVLLNLAEKLREKYSVIMLDLRVGPLQSNFQQAVDYYAGFGTRAQTSEADVALHLHLLAAHCPIYFALVNTLSAAKIPRLLMLQNIPCVHLIHEFAEAWRPRTALPAVVLHAGKLVFPAQIVLESAQRVCPELKRSDTLILPQGLCRPPTSLDPAEKETVPRALRPPGWEDAFVIFGMGSVEYRKGVDLFLLCAEQIIRRNPAKKIRFVWFGAGFVTEKTNHFGVYLEDQLRKISISGAVAILDEITDVNLAYAGADVCFISSRLDPFPLVAQEAMQHALPVLCFVGATGTAEMLAADPVTKECVLPYLDVAAAGQQLQKWIDDPGLRIEIGLRCQQMAATLFDFDHYATQIEKAAVEQVELNDRQSREAAEIEQSHILDLPYFRSPIQPEIWSGPGRYQVHSWARGIVARKPFPGFHPRIYAERNHLADSDPLVHFLRSGKPAGPWLTTVISPLSPGEGVCVGGRVALHIHLFYADMAEEISRRLYRNQTRVDLFISVPNEEIADLARLKFTPCAANRMEVAVVPNRGRDMGPFLRTFAGVLGRDYDIIGHQHTKKSLHSSKQTHIALWKDFLFENHTGGEHAMMDAILSTMTADPAIGIVFPDDPNAMGWGKNHAIANDLLSRMELPSVACEAINFPVGNFFWARTAVLQKMLDLDLQWEDFPEEPVPVDGSILHAIERLLPLVSESAGFRSAVTAVPGFTR